MKKCIVQLALIASSFGGYFNDKECLFGSTTHGSVSHREHQGVGYDTGYTSLSGFFTPNWLRPFQPFADFRGHIFNNGHFAANAGVGARYAVNFDWSLGANLYYDFRDLTKFNAHQIGPGLEVLSEKVDFRLNGYIPLNGSDFLFRPKFKEFITNHAYFTHKAKAALPNIQAEVGTLWRNAFAGMDFYFAGGTYYLFREKVGDLKLGKAWGGMARLAGRVYDGIDLGIDMFYDRIFHYNIQGYLKFSYPLGVNTIRRAGNRWREHNRTSRCQYFNTRLARNTQSVQRFEIIPVQEKKEIRKALIPSM